MSKRQVEEKNGNNDNNINNKHDHRDENNNAADGCCAGGSGTGNIDRSSDTSVHNDRSSSLSDWIVCS